MVLRKKPGLMDERLAASVLLYIAEHKEIVGDDLRKVGSYYLRLFQLVERMEEKGLVTIDRQTFPKIRYVIRITPLGEQYADRVKELYDSIESL